MTARFQGAVQWSVSTKTTVSATVLIEATAASVERAPFAFANDAVENVRTHSARHCTRGRPHHPRKSRGTFVTGRRRTGDHPPVNESQSGQDLTTTLIDRRVVAHRSTRYRAGAMSATCSCRAASATCASWTSPQPSIRRQHFRSLTELSQVRAEQNYEYDLLDPVLLRSTSAAKSRSCAIARKADHPAGGSKALLLSYNSPVWKIGNEIVTDSSRSHSLPELPDSPTTADADLTVQNDARRGTARGSHCAQPGVERRLRADRRARRQGRGSQRLVTLPTTAAPRSRTRSSSCGR
jgi:hypothetical protein